MADADEPLFYAASIDPAQPLNGLRIIPPFANVLSKPPIHTYYGLADACEYTPNSMEWLQNRSLDSSHLSMLIPNSTRFTLSSSSLSATLLDNSGLNTTFPVPNEPQIQYQPPNFSFALTSYAFPPTSSTLFMNAPPSPPLSPQSAESEASSQNSHSELLWSDDENDEDYKPSSARSGKRKNTAKSSAKALRKPRPVVTKLRRATAKTTSSSQTSPTSMTNVKQEPEISEEERGSDNNQGRECSNCHTTTSVCWRRGGSDNRKILCNRCGLFWRCHRLNRPPTNNRMLRLSTAVGEGEVYDDKSDQLVCAHCHTAVTPVWRRGPNNSRFCNSCGIYWQERQKLRPINIKTESFPNSVFQVKSDC